MPRLKVWSEELGQWLYTGPGGGSQPQTATATITTDPDTFTVVHDFDLGNVASVYARVTATVLTGDGETFGGGAGEIGVGKGFRVSRDDVTYVTINPQPTQIDDIDPSGYMVAVNQYESSIFVTARYLRVTVELLDSDSGDPYAGANNPTATVRVDVEYV